MRKQAKHFASCDNDALRLVWRPAAHRSDYQHHESLAAIGFIAVGGFALRLRTVAGRRCTPSDNLPQLPQLAFKKLGQRKPNNGGLPRLPQLAPTVFNMNRNGKDEARRVWGAGRESTSRRKTGFVQRNRATFAGPPWVILARVIRTPCFR